MPAEPQKIRTSITELLGIKHPIMLAGMHIAAGPKLAAAVCNAGGLGTIGGLGFTPDELKQQLAELKDALEDKNAPFGVDLLIPQVGGNARKTNHDYNKGRLDELVDIIVASGAKLFISAVGVPPKHIVEKIHAGGMYYMNMIGHPKHVKKCMAVGVDFLCCQGSEGGGHTGDTPSSVLVPVVADMVKDMKSPSGRPIEVIGAGGVYCGKSVASMLMYGASAVWVGTRFVLTTESKSSEDHKEAIRTAGFDDNLTTIIYTGRPLRVRNNDYIRDWEENRKEEMKQLCADGKIPVDWELETKYDQMSEKTRKEAIPLLMGKSCGAFEETVPAKQVVDEMVNGAVQWMERGHSLIVKQ